MTTASLTKGLMTLAALMGASGVALAALAAHHPTGGNVAIASSMLLFHAPAIIAACVAATSGLVSLRCGLLAAGGLALGAVLFSADLVTRDFTGAALFPMAAPSGGTLMIASWVALAIAILSKRN